MSLPEESFDPRKEAPKLYVAYIGDEARRHAFALGRRMRESGISTIIDLEGRKLKKSLAIANNLAARFAVIIGEDEMRSGAYVLRDMTTGEQKTLSESDLISTLTMFD
jgi:histidyl-tRNA synthetase